MKATCTPAEAVEKIFRLYEKHGHDGYLGECVSKTQHMIQCAMLAEKEGYGREVVLAAFFHDIGHLVGMDESLENMLTDGVDLGCKDHDVVAETYLKSFGFQASVTNLARHHVNAKRYLCYSKPDYYNNLSDASRKTLVHQGGPMSAEEAKSFEQLSNFDAILKMRTWDEMAKDATVECRPLEVYKKMCLDQLTENAV